MPQNEKTKTAPAARLSDAALVLLSQAASREDGMVLPPPSSVRARGGALDKVLAKLLRQGYVEETAAGTDEQAFRRSEDGSRIGLKITSAGLTVIGVPAVEEGQDRPAEQPAAPEPGQGRKKRPHARALEQASESAPTPLEGLGVKPASKQVKLVEQLSRPEGARIRDLVSLLGWQPHTVRAALTGLRQRGYAVARSKNEQGETIYRASLLQSASADSGKAAQAA